MTDTQQLLAEYAGTGSETAFRELVARYINFVYSVALRLVDGDSQLAEDVAQRVFITLANKGRTLSRDVMLGGWLHHLTYHVATRAVRGERRRQSREREAVEMNTLQDNSNANLRQVAPILDEAITHLGAEDRAAILLRFFEQRDFRSVGEALGTTEDAARMRVTRALDKLHSLLAHRGITTTAAALGVALSADAVQAAPAGLAAAVSGAALGGTTAAATTATAIITRAIAMTTFQKAVITVAIAAAAGTGIYEAHRAATLRNQIRSLRQEQAPLAPLQPEPDDAAKPPTPHVQAPDATRSPYEQLDEFLKSRLAPTREEIEAASQNNSRPASRALPQAEIDAYLRQNKRNAESLLAAYRMTHDPSYLREAATNFPNTPFVQFVVIADKIFPEDQRKWIDAFKASSPDNALAWYFSALDYFNSNQPDQAIQELTQATHRQSFDTYAGQTSQAVEEMCDLAGWPPLAAKAWAASSESISYLNSLKNLGNQMLQLQQQDFARGDAASANSLASIGLALGNELRTGGPIEQLVGIAIDQKILAQLDPSVNYDFLGRPPGTMRTELDQQKQAIRVALAAKDQILPTLNEADLTSYFERKKLYGEMNAVQWLQSKHPQP
ncbi:MAG TPA: sigma-70 family RNA polymerase sigma factor [Verrucomicrobiae bacterium]|nr:sigma-70 family RNA polymerase sigma factor [Verrucomicrobiae bacterium]